MQQLMLQMQQQALDRLAVIQGRVQALLTATYELHEYPIPRLFVILPKDSSASDSRPKEFFRKYGKYMLTLLEMIKFGVTMAGCTVPALAAVSASGAFDMLKNSLDTVSESAVNQSIEYLQKLSSEELEGHAPARDNHTGSRTGQKSVEGADLRHLEAFIKSKDEHRELGNLYRIISQDGNVKWVCIGHYHSAYKEQDQKAFMTAVELNGGRYDPYLGKVSVKLGSKILAAEFYDTLAKAR
ncbi:hypothetical protein BGZ96_004619, partial [Linnemannia gamsii]